MNNGSDTAEVLPGRGPHRQHHPGGGGAVCDPTQSEQKYLQTGGGAGRGLFDHRKGKIELNDYGRMFLSSVDIAFSELNAGVQNIQRMYAASQYMLSLGCNIRGYLADQLPAFSTAHPEIGIRQLDCTAQQLTEHLLDRTINLALSNEPPV